MDKGNVYRNEPLVITAYPKGFYIQDMRNGSVLFFPFKHYAKHFIKMAYNNQAYLVLCGHNSTSYDFNVPQFDDRDVNEFITRHIKLYMSKEDDPVTVQLEALNAKVDRLTQILEGVLYAPGTGVEYKKAKERQSDMKG